MKHLYVTHCSVFVDYRLPWDMEERISNTIPLVKLSSNYIVRHITWLNMYLDTWDERSKALCNVHKALYALKRKYRVTFNRSV